MTLDTANVITDNYSFYQNQHFILFYDLLFETLMKSYK